MFSNTNNNNYRCNYKCSNCSSKINIFCCYMFLLVCLLHVATAQRSSRPNDGFQSMLQHMGSGPGEAMCRISSRELLNTAQQTADRILRGVCNPRELDERLKVLETRVGEQFNVLKAMVLDLETKLRDQDQQARRQHRGLHRAITNTRNTGSKQSDPDDDAPERSTDEVAEEESDQIDDFYGADLDHLQASVRTPEIVKFNSTIHLEDKERVFTYYWKIDDIRYRMNNWGWRRTLRSPDFYIFKFGYKMFMKIFPNNQGENIYIHVGLTQGEYDASLEWPLTLGLQVSVLDHSRNPDDIKGRVWHPRELCSGLHWQRPTTGDNEICVGLGFSHNDLDIANYVYADAITIKLTVFLN